MTCYNYVFTQCQYGFFFLFKNEIEAKVKKKIITEEQRRGSFDVCMNDCRAVLPNKNRDTFTAALHSVLYKIRNDSLVDIRLMQPVCPQNKILLVLLSSRLRNLCDALSGLQTSLVPIDLILLIIPSLHVFDSLRISF